MGNLSGLETARSREEDDHSVGYQRVSPVGFSSRARYSGLSWQMIMPWIIIHLLIELGANGDCLIEGALCLTCNPGGQ